MSNLIMNHMRSLAAEEAAIREELADIREEVENITETEEEEEEYVECNQCGCCIRVGEEIEYDGDFYCSDCTVSCEYCGESVPTDEAVVSNTHLRYTSEHIACQNCAGEYFRVCDCCNEWISHSGIWAEDGDQAICENCSDNYYTCDDCGCIIHVDYSYYSDRDDGHYCESCYYNNRHSRSDNISEYGHDQLCKRYDSDAFKEMPDECGVRRYFGIEIEVDYGNDSDELADDLFDEIDDAYSLFKCKTDGSLGNEGLEIVTMPCSFQFMMEEYPFKEIAEIAVRNGYRSHDTSTCGMHIHVSRAGLGESDTEQDLTVAKLMILFDRFWDKLVTFSRRDYEQISHWCKKPDLCIEEDEDDETILDKTKEYKGRYQAINITNRQTIEFRLFRGTLKVSTILASIQFVNYMIDFVMQHSLKECMKTSWNVMFSNLFDMAEYRELAAYLQDRGL